MRPVRRRQEPPLGGAAAEAAGAGGCDHHRAFAILAAHQRELHRPRLRRHLGEADGPGAPPRPRDAQAARDLAVGSDAVHVDGEGVLHAEDQEGADAQAALRRRRDHEPEALAEVLLLLRAAGRPLQAAGGREQLARAPRARHVRRGVKSARRGAALACSRLEAVPCNRPRLRRWRGATGMSGRLDPELVRRRRRRRRHREILARMRRREVLAGLRRSPSGAPAAESPHGGLGSQAEGGPPPSIRDSL
mmetsp:Transcript_55877/g.164101  ORF Transcript_55877/g.164101 Transcript_55877/m.164101 type:complete len:248 (+) Transcript_55877:1618-2361(+)